MTKTSTLPESMAGPPAGAVSDRVLIRQFLNGSEAAATVLYDRYAARLRALVLANCSVNLARRVEAEDIVQSVFLAFFQGMRQGEFGIASGDYLWKLLLVMTLNQVRALGAFHLAAKRDVRLTTTLKNADLLWDPKLQDWQDDYRMLQLVLTDAMERLEPFQQDIASLFLQGYAIAEIAGKTGRSKRAVGRNLQKLRTQLKQLLHQES